MRSIQFLSRVLFCLLIALASSAAAQQPASPQPAPAAGPPKTYWMAKLAGAAVGLFAVASIWQLARGARKPK